MNSPDDQKPKPTAEQEQAVERALEQLERGGAEIISRAELRAKLLKSAQSGTPLRVKLGLDPTAPDIHLGFAVVLRKLRLFQDLGHQAHLIIGDFTAQIGDPSGKSKTRPQLTREQVVANAQTYKEQLFRILTPMQTQVHFNGDWLGEMSFADVVRLCSKYTVAQMLEREDFAKRLAEQKPIALHEILYPLCQGRDSVEILADVELGGTDQRFNNLVGRELQRADGQEPQVVMLMPILVGLDGVQKMSKSLGNYIGINDEPNDMFGKVMSLPDDAMETYFKLCTIVPEADIVNLLSGHPMEAKKRLAREIVAEYHDQIEAVEAQIAFEKQFSRGEVPDEMPEVALSGDEISVAELLKTCFGITGGEAKRMVGGGAVALDGEKAEDSNAKITPQTGLTVRMGKRRWAKIKVN